MAETERWQWQEPGTAWKGIGVYYVQMNPQRLATKRLRPGFFRVQKDIEIGGRRFEGVGNVALAGNDISVVPIAWL